MWDLNNYITIFLSSPVYRFLDSEGEVARDIITLGTQKKVLHDTIETTQRDRIR